MALFGEKYGDRVRVVSIGDGKFSTELCGGTHVRATGDIGLFLITEESGVAAGVRRIEAVTGLGAYELARKSFDEIRQARSESGARPGELAQYIAAQQQQVKARDKEIQQLKTRLALGGGGRGSADDDKIQIGESTLIARQISDVDSESLRTLADTLKSRLKSGVVILAAPMAEGKVSLVVTVTPDLAKKAPAGQLVKTLAPIVGGGGGGRPDFAQAGGKDASKITELLSAAQKEVTKLLSQE
jgi:alanyl-tRNA synthetase